MAQNKKIYKSQEVRYQYIRGLIEAGDERVLSFDTGATISVTYPRYSAVVQPESNGTGNRVCINAAGNHAPTNTVVSPVLYSLEFRKAWKKIADDSNARS